MDSKVEALRFFADRVAREALAQDHGHMPLRRDEIEVEASWYHDGERIVMIVEGGGQEQELALVPAGEDEEARREMVAAEVEVAFTALV